MFRLNGFSSDRVQNALTVYYDEMIGNLIEALRAQIAHPSGFRSWTRRFRSSSAAGQACRKASSSGSRSHCALRAAGETFGVRVSADPLNSTARGALMAALCSRLADDVRAPDQLQQARHPAGERRRVIPELGASGSSAAQRSSAFRYISGFPRRHAAPVSGAFMPPIGGVYRSPSAA